MLKKLLLAFVITIAAICLYAAFQPSEMFFVRELAINATPEVIFPYINNPKKAEEWMPWKDSDPQMVATYSGPEEGVGATSSWDSPGQMGSGEAKVIESILNQSVKTQLTYTKPMQMSQLAEIVLVPSAGATIVRWSVKGENSFVGRLFCLFMDMDKMIGEQFEKGLNTLKVKVETP
jgi:hypothetical protein